MKARTFRSFLTRAFGVTLISASSWASAETPYRLTDLGTLGGTESIATAMNESGQVTGKSSLTGGSSSHAFRWDGKSMQDLGTLGGTSSFGFAINSSGQVTGVAQTGSFSDHAFLWNGTGMRDLGTLGGPNSAGTAINESGHVAGRAAMSAPNEAISHAFLWDGTQMLDLGTLGGTSSSAIDINNSGQVTGLAENSLGQGRAFLWDGSVMKDLGALGGAFSNGRAINASGQVTGSAGGHAFLSNGSEMLDLGARDGKFSLGNAINSAGQVTGLLGFAATDTDPEPSQPFVWDGSAMRKIGSLTNCLFSYGEGLGINDFGQVTGYIWNKSCKQIAFLWDGGPMKDLNLLVDPADPLRARVKLMRGVDINARGQVAANGIDSRTGQSRAYLVTPLEYKIVYVGVPAGSSWKRGTTVPVKVALVSVKGLRIGDSRAAQLASACKVKFSATGAQGRAATCMKYDAVANVFYFNWKLGIGATGSTTLAVTATYRFSMPETITTRGLKTIAIAS